MLPCTDKWLSNMIIAWHCSEDHLTLHIVDCRIWVCCKIRGDSLCKCREWFYKNMRITWYEPILVDWRKMLMSETRNWQRLQTLHWSRTNRSGQAFIRLVGSPDLDTAVTVHSGCAWHIHSHSLLKQCSGYIYIFRGQCCVRWAHTPAQPWVWYCYGLFTEANPSRSSSIEIWFMLGAAVSYLDTVSTHYAQWISGCVAVLQDCSIAPCIFNFEAFETDPAETLPPGYDFRICAKCGGLVDENEEKCASCKKLLDLSPDERLSRIATWRRMQVPRLFVFVTEVARYQAVLCAGSIWNGRLCMIYMQQDGLFCFVWHTSPGK